MKRKFNYVTVGEIVQDLAKLGLEVSRKEVYNAEDLGLFTMNRTTGDWRWVYRKDKSKILRAIWENYRHKVGHDISYNKAKEKLKEKIRKRTLHIES